MYVSMKVNRTYSIDEDLIDQLKDKNASNLINELLLNHFGSNKENTDRKIAELEAELIKLNAEKVIVDAKEAEQIKENAMQIRLDKARASKVKQYEEAKKPIIEQVKANKITFEVYKTKSEELKRKYGI